MERRLGRFGLAILLVSVVLLADAPLATGELVAPGKPAPEVAPGAWINSAPLTMKALRGKVVLIDFWTYG